MLSDKERLIKAEKQIEELLEAKEKDERRIEFEEAMERFIKKQDKGFFKYSLEIFKIIVVLLVVFAGGNKALEYPLISSMFKTIGQ